MFVRVLFHSEPNVKPFTQSVDMLAIIYQHAWPAPTTLSHTVNTPNRFAGYSGVANVFGPDFVVEGAADVIISGSVRPFHQ